MTLKSVGGKEPSDAKSKDDDWITVSFTPATQPLVVHYLELGDETTIHTELIAGWLIQHKYDDPDHAIPTESRVIAGELSTGAASVFPVLIDYRQFIGIYPAGVTPPPDDVEEARNR